MFYETVVASATLFAVADANRLNKLIRKARDVRGGAGLSDG